MQSDELLKEIEELQQSLWWAGRDPLPDLPPGTAASLVMRLERLKLKMYQERGHALPHLHVDYGNEHHVASYSIDPAVRIEGSLSRKYDYAVVSWIERFKGKLLELWRRLQSGDHPEVVLMELRGDA